MNDIDAVETSPLSNIRRLLPRLLILMIALGNIAFFVAVILPAWRSYDAVQTQINAAQTQVAGRTSESDVPFLSAQATSIQGTIAAAADNFWAEPQVDQVLSRLYSYAEDSGVRIISLQSSPTQSTTTPTVVTAHTFRIQAQGAVNRLLNLVARFRETTLPTVSVADLRIQTTDNGTILSITVTIYTSQLASGSVFNTLAGISTPSAVPASATATYTPSLTLTPSNSPTPTATFTATPTATATRTPTATPTSTSTLTATATATSTFTATPTATFTPTLDTAGKCGDQVVQNQQALIFSRRKSATTQCTIQVWTFVLDREYTYVLDVQPTEGSASYQIELLDSAGKALSTAPASNEGRGLLAARTGAGTYTVRIVPTIAKAAWTYSIVILNNLPTLSFTATQSSYSSHSSVTPGVTDWEYTLRGTTEEYEIRVTRMDGSLEYDLTVLDENQKEVATARSDRGNLTLRVKTGPGTYRVRVLARDGTSGSYRIGLGR